MTRRSVALAAGLFILASVALPLPAAGSSVPAPDQAAPPQKAAPPPALPQPAADKSKAETGPAAGTETVHPGPKDIRERSAVYVFLAWLWLTIAVLIYVLVLKIRESDRIFSLRYHRPEKGPEGPG